MPSVTKTIQATSLRPARIDIGARIGIAAPASPFDETEFKRGLAVLKSMGYETVAGEKIFLRRGYLAGDDADRAAVLNGLFSDRKIDAIMCARGGYGSMRLLDKLDYDLIRANPKVLVGFSDISALLAVIQTRCGLVGFHGPTVTALAEADDATLTALKNGLGANQPPVFDMPAAQVLYEGRATGTVAGGNLSVLSHLVGTNYCPDYKGCILVLEDRAEAPYRIDRMLTQMHLAGVFDGIAGLVLGRFSDCGPAADVIRVFAEKFGHAGIPVLAGFAVGHGATNLTFPIGETATLDTETRRLVYDRAPTHGRR